jgi:hypothetical protein
MSSMCRGPKRLAALPIGLQGCLQCVETAFLDSPNNGGTLAVHVRERRLWLRHAKLVVLVALCGKAQVVAR